MRRFYQESWQGIPFTVFAHISFFHLAEPRFYAVFYEELFRRYKDWDDLPSVWRTNKNRDAKWLADRLRARKGKSGPLRALSIGSGVGYMEKVLLDEMPELELHVNEPSTVGMKWLRRHIPAERIYIGLPSACLPPDVHYDMIYLSAVDYGVNTQEMEHLLGQLRAQLAPGGETVCLSASLLEEESCIGSLVNTLKIIIRGVLHCMGIRRQQFWGWRRTRKEYHRLFLQAGFDNIADGRLDDDFDTYWIRGD